MTFLTNRRHFILAASATIAAPALVRAQTRREVKFVRAPWDSFWFAGYVAKTGLEQLGYKVAEPQVMTPAPMFQAIAQGDADFTLDVVMPGANLSYDKVKDRVSLLGPTVQPGSVAGYLIDKATSEKHGVKHITDFRDAKVAALFSEGMDKRARLIGPGAGFNDEKRAQDDMQRLGLKDTVNLVTGEYNVLLADVVTRYKAGKSVFFYAWFPNVGTVELLPGRDVVWLTEPGASEQLAFKDVPGCATGGTTCNTGWSPTTYFIAANATWLEQNKSAAKFLGAMRMMLQDRVEQNTLMSKGEKQERDLRRHAATWIERNQKSFDAWIAAAKA